MGSLVQQCPFSRTSYLTGSLKRLRYNNKKLSTTAVQFSSTMISQQQCRTMAFHGGDLMGQWLQLLPIQPHSQIYFTALLPASPPSF